MKLIMRLMMLAMLLSGAIMNSAFAAPTSSMSDQASYCDSYQPGEAPAHCMKTECAVTPGCPCGGSACFYSKLSIPNQMVSEAYPSTRYSYQYIYLYQIHRPPKAA